MKPRIVKSAFELKEILKNGKTGEFAVLLNYGLKSVKNIRYDRETDEFHIQNLIDDSEQTFDPCQIVRKENSNIGEAMEKNSFIFYEYV